MSNEPLAPPTDFTDPEPPRPPQWRGALASLGIGILAALLGLLPWMLGGMRLMNQPLWEGEAPWAQMPGVLLPLGHSTILPLLGVLLVAWAAAGIAARALAHRLPSRAPLSVAAGVFFVQLVALLQSAQTLRDGLRAGDAATFYFIACISVAVLGIVAGLLAFLLVARAPRGGALLGLVLGTIAANWWIEVFFRPRGPVPTDLYGDFSAVWRWVPPALVGVAIAWAGARTRGRIVAALASLLMLWVLPSVAAAVSASLGPAVMLRYTPGELLDYFGNVLRTVLFLPSFLMHPLIIAVVVAAAGILGRELLRRRTG